MILLVWWASLQELSYVRILFHTARQHEARLQQVLESTQGAIEGSDAEADLIAAIMVYSELYQRAGHWDSFRRLVRLHKLARARFRNPPPHYAFTADGRYTVSVAAMENVRKPVFREKYRLFIFFLGNRTNETVPNPEVEVEAWTAEGLVQPVDPETIPELKAWARNVRNRLRVPALPPRYEVALYKVYPRNLPDILYFRVRLRGIAQFSIPMLEQIFE